MNNSVSTTARLILLTSGAVFASGRASAATLSQDGDGTPRITIDADDLTRGKLGNVPVPPGVGMADPVRVTIGPDCHHALESIDFDRSFWNRIELPAIAEFELPPAFPNLQKIAISDVRISQFTIPAIGRIATLMLPQTLETLGLPAGQFPAVDTLGGPLFIVSGPISAGRFPALTTLAIHLGQREAPRVAIPSEQLRNVERLTIHSDPESRVTRIELGILGSLERLTFTGKFNVLEEVVLPPAMARRLPHCRTNGCAPGELAEFVRLYASSVGGQTLEFESRIVPHLNAAAAPDDVATQEALAGERGRLVATWERFVMQDTNLLGTLMPPEKEDAARQFSELSPTFEAYLVRNERLAQFSDEERARYERLSTGENLRLLEELTEIEKSYGQAPDSERRGIAKERVRTFKLRHPDVVELLQLTRKRAERFFFENAMLGLRVLQGDATAPRHVSSRIEDYRHWPYRERAVWFGEYAGMPDHLQAWVFAYRLLEKSDRHAFAETWIAEHETSPEKRALFDALFRNYRRFFTLGEALVTAQGKALVSIIVATLEGGDISEEMALAAQIELTAPVMRQLRDLRSRYDHKLRNEGVDFRSLAEDVRMIPRGHARRFDDESEPHNPSCADGAYMRTMLTALRLAGMPLHVEVAACE